MVSPPSLRQWVGMLFVVAVQFPGAQERCIFDEVQSGVRVVIAPPTRSDGPPRTSPRSSVYYTPAKDNRPVPRSITHRGASLRQRMKLAERVPPSFSTQPIRIRSWVPRENSVQSPEESKKVETAVEEALTIISSLLSVNRVPGRLLLSRDANKYCKFLWRNLSAANYNRCGRANENYRNEMCLDITIPDDHLGGCDVYPHPDSPIRTVVRHEGAGLTDTDFLLYLQVQNTDKCRAEPSVLAYAVHCQTDLQGRPLAGVVVICRDRLMGKSYSHLNTVQTLIHELFHILGFSQKLFNTWRDCSSTMQVGVDCSARGRVVQADSSGQMRVYTQSVISAMQNHLGSKDPELGGPLENLDGGPQGVSSHWEARVLQGSIMAAVLDDPAVVRVDPITLAALEDTGWYTVHRSQGQSLVWGQVQSTWKVPGFHEEIFDIFADANTRTGQGSQFGSLTTCLDTSTFYFCTGSGLGCHYLHLHKGECQTDKYLQGCRLYKVLKKGSECWKEENIMWSSEKQSGEVYGQNSRCFFSNLTEMNNKKQSVVGCCYRHRCIGPNRYQIQLSGSEWIDCPTGGAAQVPGYQGVVFCPERRLCQGSQVSSTVVPLTSTSESHRSQPPDQTWPPVQGPGGPRAPPGTTTWAVLCTSAAVVFVGVAVVATNRKCIFRTRVHAASGTPTGCKDSTDTVAASQ